MNFCRAPSDFPFYGNCPDLKRGEEETDKKERNKGVGKKKKEGREEEKREKKKKEWNQEDGMKNEAER